MNHQKILLTGSKGTIGTVLMQGLADQFEMTGLDLPEADISNFAMLRDRAQGMSAIVHVAHSFQPHKETWLSESINPRNILLELNVLQAAVEADVPRVIMASSVHADHFLDHYEADLLSSDGHYGPATPYGTHKLILEEIGKFYASHHRLEFVAIRFGGVTRDNAPRSQGREPMVWLSHRDLISAVRACLQAERVPGGAAVFYAISDNTGRIHSTENPFDWTPQDNAEHHKSSN